MPFKFSCCHLPLKKLADEQRWGFFFKKKCINIAVMFSHERIFSFIHTGQVKDQNETKACNTFTISIQIYCGLICFLIEERALCRHVTCKPVLIISFICNLSSSLPSLFSDWKSNALPHLFIFFKKSYSGPLYWIPFYNLESKQ